MCDTILKYIEALANLAIFGGIVLAYKEYKSAKNQQKIDADQQKLAAVIQILEKVGHKKQRAFRKVIYEVAEKGLTKLNDDQLKAFEEVSVTFDRIGMYAKHNSLLKKIAIDNHYEILIKCWNVSLPWIKKQYDKYGDKEKLRYRFYRELVDDAKKQYPKFEATIKWTAKANTPKNIL